MKKLQFSVSTTVVYQVISSILQIANLAAPSIPTNDKIIFGGIITVLQSLQGYLAHLQPSPNQPTPPPSA